MRKRIGEFLIEKGVLTESQVMDILRYASTTGLRFGEAAVALKMLNQEKLIEVFGPSYGVNFFHLESAYFPAVTQAWLPVETMIRLGVLPLGFKTESKFFRAKKMLNLGLLDPSRSDAIEEIESILRERFDRDELHGFKLFLLLSEQFLGILRDVYRVSEESLRKLPPQALDPTLSMFLTDVNYVG